MGQSRLDLTCRKLNTRPQNAGVKPALLIASCMIGVYSIVMAVIITPGISTGDNSYRAGTENYSGTPSQFRKISKAEITTEITAFIPELYDVHAYGDNQLSDQ